MALLAKQSNQQIRRIRRRGATLIYASVMLTVLVGLMMLSVDIGRVSLAKSELQATADSAARYAAAGMMTNSYKSSTAITHAQAVAGESKVDGRVPTIANSDVQIGIWDSLTKTFTPTNVESLANAVRVTVQQTVGGTGSMPTFAQAIGLGSKTLRRTSYAMATSVSVDVTAPSSGNLWLAGMPYNTQITNLQGNSTRYDNSGTAGNPKQRPVEISLSTLGVDAGDIITFEGLSGSGSNGGGAGTTNADGNQSWNVALGNSSPTSTPTNSVNGISNVIAPIASVMGVFLSDSSPNSGSAPSCLDFSTSTLRDYSTISPQLKQTFFVGDGKTSAGLVQHITVPAGATRVFLGMMDAWQWNDNTGSFNIKFYKGVTISTVK